MTAKSKIKKILFWLCLLLICCLSTLFMGEFTSPTAEIAFRKMEKQHLIGPAQIVEVLDFENSCYDHLLIGKSQYGYTFFEWNDRNPDGGRITYQKKAGPITLFCTHDSYEFMYREKEWLPIFAFAENTKAVRAELTVESNWKTDNSSHQLSAQLTDRGYFLFRLPMSAFGGEDFWLLQQVITGAYAEYELSGSISVTVTLYDKAGNLLETMTLTK